MGFWEKLGKAFVGLAGATANLGGAPGAYNLAQSASASRDQSTLDILANAGDQQLASLKRANEDRQRYMAQYNQWESTNPVAKYTLHPVHDAASNVTRTVVAPLIWTGDKVDHGLAAAYLANDYNRIDNPGSGDWSVFFHSAPWKEAWDYSNKNNVGVGDAFGFGLMGGTQSVPDKLLLGNENGWRRVIADDSRAKRDLKGYKDGLGGKLLSGGTSIALTWYADPYMAAGKVAKLARAANRIQDAAEAERVFQSGAGATGDVSRRQIAGSVFGRGADTKSQRLGRTVQTLDNVSSNAQVAAKFGPILKRSGDAAPIVDLLAQAGKIEDVETQRIVKHNIVLASMGSQGARRELVEMAPAIARAMNRVSTAPEEMARLDDLFKYHAGDMAKHGDSLSQAATAMGSDLKNAKEIEAYGSTLDHLHQRLDQLDDVASFGGVEQGGRTALDRAKMWARAQGVNQVYQDSVSGRTMNVLHTPLRWGGMQAGMGTIAVRDAMRGQAELADTMRKSKLFAGPEIEQWVNRYLGAATQADRARVVEELPDEMLARLGNKRGLSPEAIKEITKSTKSAFNAGRKHSTNQLETARAAGLDRVTINDAAGNHGVSVKAAVLETHIRDAVPVPDLDTMNRAIDVRNREESPFESVKRAVSGANGVANYAVDYWRIGALARPGLFFRTQLDTQPRVAVALGVAAYTRQAMGGGRNFLLNAPGKITRKGQLADISASVEDFSKADDLRTQAKLLRHRADMADGVPMQNRPMADVAASHMEQIDGQIESLFKQYEELGKKGEKHQAFFDKRAERTGDALDGLDFNASDLMDEIGSYEAALEPFGYKRRTGMMQRITSAQDHLAGMRDELFNLRHSRASLEAQLEAATGEKAQAALQKKLDTITKRQNKLESGIYQLGDLKDIWAQRAGQGDLFRETPASRLHARADRMEKLAEEFDNRARVASKRRIGASNQKVNLGNGRSATTRAFADVQEEADLKNGGLLAGDSTAETISDVMIGQHSKKLAKIYENGDDWITYAPEHENWNRAYVRATDAIRNSYTGRRILREGDLANVDLVAGLRNDPRVVEEWRKVRQNNIDFDSWLARVIHYTDWHTPTPELRKRLAWGPRMADGEVDTYFAQQARKPKLTPEEKKAQAQTAKEDRRAAREADAEANPTRGRTLDTDDRSAKLRAKRGMAPEPVVDPRTALTDAEGRALRFHVHGPSTSMLEPDFKGLPGTELAGRLIGKLSDQPDVVLGRSPLYVGRYFQHFKELATRELDRTGEAELSTAAQAKIEKVAKHRAIQDVHQTLYDTSRHTNAHVTMRHIVPFMGAWQDAMESWSRLVYDDPTRLGTMLKAWEAPERMNLVVDENGNAVQPGQSVKQAFIALPVPVHKLPLLGYAGGKDFKFRKDGLNSVIQGEVPWMPGFGPKVQIPANEIVGKMFPEVGESNNPVVRSMFPNGVPKRQGLPSDMWEALAPSYAKRVFDAIDPTNNGAVNVYGDAVYSQVIQANKDHKPVDWKKIDANALKTARNVSIIRALSIGVFGLSSEAGMEADFYREQYNLMRQREDEIVKSGSTVEQEFAKEHPEAANLDFRMTANNTGINAYVKSYDAARKFRKQIAANPEFGWFYVGAENVGGKFSQSIYNAQRSDRVGPNSSMPFRDKLDPQGILKHAQAEQGWTEYNRVATKLHNVMVQRGIPSLNMKGNEDLLQIKRRFVQQLAAQNPEWARDRAAFDPTKTQRFLDTVARPATTDPALRNRSDIQAMAVYLKYRDAIMKRLEGAGVTTLSANRAAPMRDILSRLGEALAAQDIGFQQVWQRALQHETEPTDQQQTQAEIDQQRTG